MSRRVVIGLVALAASIGGGVSAQPVNRAPDCVVVRAQPSLGAYGVNHMVVVQNRCDVRVVCEVATNVDPEPRYTLTVEPGTEASVRTRSESPASAFQPLYTCDAR